MTAIVFAMRGSGESGLNFGYAQWNRTNLTGASNICQQSFRQVEYSMEGGGRLSGSSTVPVTAGLVIVWASRTAKPPAAPTSPYIPIQLFERP